MSVGHYYESRVLENATVTANRRIVLPRGLGSCNQITGYLTVASVSGGADTFDVSVDTSFVRNADGEDEWFSVVPFTQVTATDADEFVIVRRGATDTWSDLLSIELELGAGATATGVTLTVVGANA